jgi:hypothetical protein
MADFVRVTIIPSPDAHPEHVQPFLTWINLALVYQLRPATDAEHPGARTHLIDVHGRSLYVQENVEEILEAAQRGGMSGCPGPRARVAPLRCTNRRLG